jgi:leader peptidase (prepilin peptidase)/N-methyltransferase
MGEAERALFQVFAALFGLVVGSFLNVCIFRLPRNCMSVAGPRSRCPRCLRTIPWHDNIPVLSWVALRGRCRFCRAPISPRYAAVELLTGALFAWAAARLLWGPRDPGAREAALFLVHAWFLGSMIVCTFIDLDFRILPDEVTLSGTAIGVAVSTAFPFLHEGGLPAAIGNPHAAALVASTLGAVVGAGTLWGVGVLGKLVFRKEAMGFGDVKYMAMIGSVLGWKGVLLTFVLACLFGSIVGVGKYLAVRRMGYVPFGPFLSAGALVMLLIPEWVDRAVRAYLNFLKGPVLP